MKVLALAADNGGTGFYRIKAPSAEVAKLGVEVKVSDGIDADAVRFPDGMVSVKEVKEDVDLIVIQRPLDNSLTAIIEQAHNQGIATIVDLDDDFSTVHQFNVAREGIVGKDNLGPQWVEKAASIADLVTVSTPQLTKYARHGRHAVLRNCVPDSIFTSAYPAKSDQQWPRVGWTGSVQTHPDDLQQTKGAVAEVLKKNNLPFNVVGDGEYVATNLRLHDDTPIYATGWVDLGMYYSYLHSFIDVGIVPLELSPFNQSKSALKGLEYAALGIPFIASPTREYERLEAYGIGKTARTPGEWRKHLQRMIDRPQETERIAKESRDRIKSDHVYSASAPQWLEAWEKAVSYRKTLK